MRLLGYGLAALGWLAAAILLALPDLTPPCAPQSWRSPLTGQVEARASAPLCTTPRRP